MKEPLKESVHKWHEDHIRPLPCSPHAFLPGIGRHHPWCFCHYSGTQTLGPLHDRGREGWQLRKQGRLLDVQVAQLVTGLDAPVLLAQIKISPPHDGKDQRCRGRGVVLDTRMLYSEFALLLFISDSVYKIARLQAGVTQASLHRVKKGKDCIG